MAIVVPKVESPFIHPHTSRCARFAHTRIRIITWADLGVNLVIVLGAMLGAIKRYAPLPDGIISAGYDALVYGTLLFIVARRIKRSRIIIKTLVMVPLLLFCLYSFLTIFFPQYVPLTQGLLGWRFMSSGLLFYFVGLFAYRSLDRVERMLEVFWITAAVVAIYGLMQYVRGYTYVELVWIESLAATMSIAGTGVYRLMSTMGSAVDLGFFLALSFSSLLGYVLFFPKRRGRYLFVLGLLAITLVLTFVRAAWVSVFIASVYLLFARTWQNRRMRLLRPVVILFGFLLVLLLPLLVTPVANQFENPALRERIGSLSNPLKDNSMQDRLRRWQEVWSVIREHPLGTGTGTTGAASLKFPERGFMVTVDNSYLKILLETGWIGLLIFLTLIVSTLRSQARDVQRLTGRRKKLVHIFVATTISFAVILVFGEYIELNPARLIIWLFIGVSNSVPYLVDERGLRSSTHANPIG